MSYDRRGFKSLTKCLAKRPFTDFDRAYGEANRLQKLRGVKLYPYFCPVCSNFHLTKKEQVDAPSSLAR